jgi:membrane protein YdbS with pleckstrin-like domain
LRRTANCLGPRLSRSRWLALTPDALADSASRLRQPSNLVCGRAKVFWTVRALIGWTALIGLQLLVLFLTDPSSHLGVNVGFLIATVVVGAAHLTVMPRWRYRVHRWEVTNTACYAQAGWIVQERRIAPLSRIQTVDSHRGPLEQLFSLANVTVTTASAAGPIKIRGLDSLTADQLVDQLTRTTAASEGDAT